MNPTTLLYRQVHPSWIQQGRPTSQTFKPTAKDKGKPSAYDGDQISPLDSFTHYTSVLKFESVGVLAVTLDECTKEGVPVIPDPLPYKEHCVFDMSDFSVSDVVNKAKKLVHKAKTRDWLYKPESNPPEVNPN